MLYPFSPFFKPYYVIIKNIYIYKTKTCHFSIPYSFVVMLLLIIILIIIIISIIIAVSNIQSKQGKINEKSTSCLVVP